MTCLCTTAGYGPKGGGPYMSPGDSAIGSGVSSGMVSGVQSGGQNKAHSDVAPGDLEQLDSDEIPPQQQPQQQQSFGKIHLYVVV